MSIEWVYARRELDLAVEKLLDRTEAFQSITTVPPLSQLFLALDALKDDDIPQLQLAPVLSFLDGSLSQFMLKRYYFIDEGLSLDVRDEINSTISFAVLAFRHQWRMLMTNKAEAERLRAISRWLVDFLVRLYYIGENPNIISAFISEINEGLPDASSNLVHASSPSSPGHRHAKRLPPKFRYYLASSVSGDIRTWSNVCDLSISEIVMYLESDEIDKAYGPLESRISMNGVSVSSFVILCILRRVVNLHLSTKSNLETTIPGWFNLLVELLSLQQKSAPDEFVQSKVAMSQLFSVLISNFASAPMEMSRFIDGERIENFPAHDRFLGPYLEILFIRPL